ncbi:hypothetical protein H3G97_27515 [Klebsiella pneumoniae]|nr:hypothetical protein [Klebsiella pneumoniae]MBA5293344.1 hypothetical protein [Klebsiella pneumoniae]MBA5298814.1 hypothetical protein [Klebsiella pneumoniae]MBA5309908.1 hypothetical protein [Klebsiella pneumoniae]MBA5333133.1 hypothetical protein [Klebsiella pneumoniae]
MKGWLFLVIAIVGEVIATSALKSSEGFTKREHEKPRGSHRMMPSTGVKITTIIS